VGGGYPGKVCDIGFETLCMCVCVCQYSSPSIIRIPGVPDNMEPTIAQYFPLKLLLQYIIIIIIIMILPGRVFLLKGVLL
jgi:hypothetical protein